MPENLEDNLDSSYIKAYNDLSPKAVAKKVEVYVEGNEDVPFWRNILHQYQNAKLKFNIQPATRKGKQSLIGRSSEILNLLNHTGEYLIICVDSDYDYLLQGATEQSRLVIENPYIFHTYSYSIENLRCYSDSLHSLCVQATKNDDEILDFNALLITYSSIIYPLFLWNVYFYRQGDTTTFSIGEFCSVAMLTGGVDIDTHCEQILSALIERVNEKVAQLKEQFPDSEPEVVSLGAELHNMGVKTENAYLFIQGHTLKDSVVLFILKRISHELTSRKFAQINIEAKHPNHAEQQRNEYKSGLLKMEHVLAANTEFKTCFLYEKIKNDFDRYVNNTFA